MEYLEILITAGTATCTGGPTASGAVKALAISMGAMTRPVYMTLKIVRFAKTAAIFPVRNAAEALRTQLKTIQIKELLMNNTPTPATGEMLMGLFRRLGRGMDRARHHHGHAHHAQIHTLAAIQEKNPMSQRDLLELLDVRSSSLSEILAKLERGELITRERDERDKRNVILAITEKGTAEIETLKEHRRQSAEGVFKALSQEEKDQLYIILEKVTATLETEFQAECDPREHCRREGHHHRGCHGGHGHGHRRHGHGDERL